MRRDVSRDDEFNVGTAVADPAYADAVAAEQDFLEERPTGVAANTSHPKVKAKSWSRLRFRGCPACAIPPAPRFTRAPAPPRLARASCAHRQLAHPRAARSVGSRAERWPTTSTSSAKSEPRRSGAPPSARRTVQRRSRSPSQRRALTRSLRPGPRRLRRSRATHLRPNRPERLRPISCPRCRHRAPRRPSRPPRLRACGGARHRASCRVQTPSRTSMNGRRRCPRRTRCPQHRSLRSSSRRPRRSFAPRSSARSAGSSSRRSLPWWSAPAPRSC